MKILARKASAADFEEIVSLWRRFMTEEDEAVSDAKPNGVEEAWKARLVSQISASKAIVADNGDCLVGFLAFIDSDDRQWVPAGVAYVVDMYVSPEARASATAKALFRATAELLQTVYSETWTNTHIKNRRMQILLKRAGFETLDGFEIEGLRDQLYFRLDNNAMQAGVRTSRR
jgi:ribosomal protein S18 acetylase RimI-like enzyme